MKELFNKSPALFSLVVLALVSAVLYGVHSVMPYLHPLAGAGLVVGLALWWLVHFVLKTFLTDDEETS